MLDNVINTEEGLLQEKN